MDSAEPAEKVCALEADLAAKSFRIAELEARVSLLEAENARLRRAIAKGEEAPDLRGEEDPIFGRLEYGSGGQKQTAADKLGGDGACGVILSDGEEGIAVDASKGISPEVGVAAVPTTRIVTGEVEGGSESSKGEARCDSNLWLEDDDVLVTTRGKKRAVAAARVVTSDSEDEDEDGGELGCADDDDGQEMGAPPSRKRARRGIIDSEEEDGNEGVHIASLERLSCLVTPGMESEDEDDRIPISQVLKKIRKERVSDDDNEEFSDAKGCCTPATRRSARLVKNQAEKRQTARRVLSFVEPKEYERSDDDTEEDDDMGDFIDDEGSSDHASDSADESRAETEVSDASAPDEEMPPELEESDNEINYAHIMASIGRKRKTKDWKLEGEMLAAFDEHPELCLKAVCALYRRQTKEEQLGKATFVHNKIGFNQIDAPSLFHSFCTDLSRSCNKQQTFQQLISSAASQNELKADNKQKLLFSTSRSSAKQGLCVSLSQFANVRLQSVAHCRASCIAEFLLDGDLYGPLKKTVRDLEGYDHSAFEFCCKVASRYSKQLFTIYQNKEDGYFHP